MKRHLIRITQIFAQNELFEQKDSKNSSMETDIVARRKRKIIFGLLILLGVVAVVVVGIFYLLQEHSPTLAPEFSLTDLNGNAFNLSDFKGKVVVIDFMATWCGPCRLEMPEFKVIWEKYEDDIVMMSIDIDPTESVQTLRSYAQEFPYATWTWARDTANLGQAYHVTRIPKTVIIDQDGYIRFTHVGVTPSSTFIQEVDQLLPSG